MHVCENVVHEKEGLPKVAYLGIGIAISVPKFP